MTKELRQNEEEINGLFRKIRELFVLARKDERYAELARDYLALEDQFGKIASRLSKDEENVLWGYICIAEEMNNRMLAILLEGFEGPLSVTGI